MKRSSLLLATLIAFGLGACGESSPPAQKSTTTPAKKTPEIAKPDAAAPTPPPPPPPAEPAKPAAGAVKQ